MKAAIFIDSLAIGGAQKHVRQLACGLAARGHDLTVFCLNAVAHPVYVDALRTAGVRVKVIGKFKVMSGWGLIETANALRRERCDVIVTVLFASTLFGRAVSLLTGRIPVVTCLQARNVDYGFGQKILLRGSAALTSFTVSNSRSAIAWAAKHEGLDAARCEFVANALDPVSSVDGAGEKREPPGWTALGFPSLEGKTVIGSLGRLNRQKGYDVLLDAFARIAATHERCDVLLVGQGPERSALLRQAQRLGIANRVWFAGERAEPQPLLEKMDLYVQPSRFEGTPNAVMEAMAAGRAVIATAVDGQVELITDPSEARLLPPENPEELARALAELSVDPAARAAMGESARRRVAEGFRVEDLCGRYEEILRACATRSRENSR